jgi:hypothetical protein
MLEKETERKNRQIDRNKVKVRGERRREREKVKDGIKTERGKER